MIISQEGRDSENYRRTNFSKRRRLYLKKKVEISFSSHPNIVFKYLAGGENTERTENHKS